MSRTDDELLLGEWACLGILTSVPAHGFAVAQRLRPDGDIGRAWSLSRPLTYRALDQLLARGLVQPVATEAGRAGGQRTVLAVTAAGADRLHSWLGEPVRHLRDMRSELLLKLLLSDLLGRPTATLLRRQRDIAQQMAQQMAPHVAPHTQTDVRPDPVALWREEASLAALRFVDRLLAARPDTRRRASVL